MVFFSHSDIQYLKSTLPGSVEPEFFEFLKSLTTKDVTLYAIEEGSVVFPRYDYSMPILSLMNYFHSKMSKSKSEVYTLQSPLAKTWRPLDSSATPRDNSADPSQLC